MPDDNENANNAKKSKVISRRCNTYNKINHNARTYPIKID